MLPKIPRLPDLTAADIRAVQRLTGRLIEAPDLEILGSEFVHGVERILPADFMLWNLWTPSMDQILSCQANDNQLRRELEKRSDALNATIHHHPVIASGHLGEGWFRPLRMSDYQSPAAFKSNPIFREVYRHVDSHFQVGFGAARLNDAYIILSWNMKHRDFTDREGQLLQLLGMQGGVLAHRIAERQRLRAAWEALSLGLNSLSGGSGETKFSEILLTPNDGRILAGLIRGEARTAIAQTIGWRRDTLDRYLAALRERLGFENTAQLLQAFASLRPPAGQRKPEV